VGGAAALARVNGTRLALTRHRKTVYGDEVIMIDQITDYPDRMWMFTKTPLFEATTVSTPAESFTVAGGTVRDLPPTMRPEVEGTIRLGLISVAKHAQDPKYTFAIAGEEIVGGLRTAVLEIALVGKRLCGTLTPQPVA
jgi:hypothetical protein